MNKDRMGKIKKLKIKKRRPTIALLLSFATPGLGQIYNGQIKKAIVLYLTGLFLGIILFFLFITNVYVMICCLVILICYFLYICFDAVRNSSKLKQIILKPYNKWYFYIIIALVSGFVINPSYRNFIKHNIVQAYRIRSSGMEPTLLVNDHIVTSKFVYNYKGPIRGGVIVFVYPEDPRKDFVKRIIALPGEKVEIKNKKIFINDKPITDPWGVYRERDGPFVPGDLRPRDNYGPRVVPSNSLFVLGDNRDNSQDSRYWGFIDLSAVKGKVLYIYWAKNKNRIGMNVK